MRKFIPLLVASSLLLATSVSVSAQQPPGRRGPGREAPAIGARGDRAPRANLPNARRGDAPRQGGLIGRRLGLTTEQQAKVREIYRDARDKSGPITDELRLAQNTLRRETFADTRDDTKVTELSKKTAELRGQLSDIRQNAASAVAGVLTPEQRELVRANQSGRRGAGGGARMPFRGRGPDRGRNG